MTAKRPVLLTGDPAPMFTCRSSTAEAFTFASIAGRYIVLSFFGSSAGPEQRKILEHFSSSPRFDDRFASFFGVSLDPADEQVLRQRLPGIRYFWDFDHTLAKLYGLAEDAERGAVRLRGTTFLLDPTLRVLAKIPLGDADSHIAAFEAMMAALPEPALHTGTQPQAPVLIVPRVFEPEFCRKLIAHYQKIGGQASGFMREIDGKTVGVMDSKFKRREDVMIEDDALRAGAAARIRRRLAPEIFKAFQFEVTQLERYLVACYNSESQGFFKPHRDNTTKGTAHRRFAVTINLNAEEFEGGNLRFPEFGPQSYRAPTGGAVVFSCSLLHEALPVTKGDRYAFLPFLYNDEAAKQREENKQFLSGTMIDKDAPQ